MRAVDIIEKKRDGHELAHEEIEFFVNGYTRGDIPDYQAAAWCMAVLLRGMTPRETTDLALAMAHSGKVLDLRDVAPLVVDKHSSGGVGDKVSLVVAPVVAASGLPVGKMSGRGLAFSGGTLDKLESIRGYRTDLSEAEFHAQLKRIGIVLTGQSVDLAPADGKLYALRDVTGTVPSLPLIAASIMSKKIAGGADAIVLDVKTGSGAFMKTEADARALAGIMVDIGKMLDRRMVALISDMNQPLGRAVGNALELREAIETLHSHGPLDFTEHCLTVAAHMLRLGAKATSVEQGRALAESLIREGKAWQKFVALVRAQGGDVSQVEQPDRLPRASIVRDVPSPRGGAIARVDALEIGLTAVTLGAGRAKKGDPIDHAVGIEVEVKVGDRVEAGTPLFTIHANDERRWTEAARRLLDAVSISDTPVARLPLFYGTIE
ncbi:MAG TPA: thymidine phosphorylase [Anaerolineae bacterium]